MFVSIIVILFLIAFISLDLFLKEGRRKKILKRITIAIFVILCIVMIRDVFWDDFFSKRNAIELLKKNEIILADDFEILSNKSVDDYQVFTLRISSKDRMRLIKELKTLSDSSKSQVISIAMADSPYLIQIRIDETDAYFMREQNISSRYEKFGYDIFKTQINKKDDVLTFEAMR